MSVTSIQSLKSYAAGTEVHLPGFVEDEPFVALLRRPSIMLLAESGTIPNPLLSTASELFRSGAIDPVKDGESLKSMAKVLICIAQASLISPTFEQIIEAGITLTDLQLIHIYNFAQVGVDPLKRFPKK